MLKNRYEQGQVLILIVLGLTAIVAIVGLAVDGAHVFADRSQAQNAADAAAMASAIAYVSNQNYKDAAIYQIKNNGYLGNGAKSSLEVNQPPIDGAYSCAVRPDCKDYIQVKLTSTISTWFAPVVGINSLTNQVSAVAHAVKSTQEPFFGGHALVALDTAVCKAMNLTGNGSVVVDGAGIFVNSNCNNTPATNPLKAFYNGGNSRLLAPYVKVVGGAYYSPNAVKLESPLATGAFPLLPIKDAYILPSPGCGGAGGVDPLDPTVANPGSYTDFPPDGVTSLNPGIYCVDSLKIHDKLVGGDVLFVLSGGVRMDPHAYIVLKARTQGEFAGLLMYMLPAHEQQITIDGNIASEFTGLILAPRSPVTIHWGGKAGHFTGQIVADTISFTGDSDVQFNYDQSAIYLPFTNPRVELVH